MPNPLDGVFMTATINGQSTISNFRYVNFDYLRFNNSCHVLPQYAAGTDGKQQLQIDVVGINEADIPHIIWSIKRNDNDYFHEPCAKLTIDNSNPMRAYVDTTYRGSFAITVFYRDPKAHPKSNPALNYIPVTRVVRYPDKIRCVFNLVLVSIEVIGTSTIKHKSNPGKNTFPSQLFHYKMPDGTTQDEWVIYSQVNKDDPGAMYCEANVLIRGGGESYLIGLNRIHLGWIQNGVAKPPTEQYLIATYVSNKTMVNRCPVGPSTPHYPYLDAGKADNTTSGTGGNTAFLSQTKIEPLTSLEGLAFNIKAQDGPNQVLYAAWPNSNPADPIASVDKGSWFSTYLCLYSSDWTSDSYYAYNSIYVAAAKFDWKVFFVGTFNGLVFTDTGCLSSAPLNVTRLLPPQSAHDAGINTLRPTFAASLDWFVPN